MKIEDWIGKRFGIREVIGIKATSRNRRMVMKCECGNISLADQSSLKAGRRLSCVKCKKKTSFLFEKKTSVVIEKKRPVVKDRAYRKFLSFAENDPQSKRLRINVQCICGVVSTVKLSDFNAGHAESCGACGQLRRRGRLGLSPQEDVSRYLTDKEKERLRFFVTMAGSQRKLADKINMRDYRISEALSDRYRIPAGRLMRSLDKISEEMKENRNA